jgi:hypothetical protein
MSMSDSPAALEALLAQIERAQNEVSAINHGKKWQMRVPVDETDSDVVIAGALAAATAALRALIADAAWRGRQKRPTIVCLCGSTRFFAAFQQANYEETMAGRIVLSVGFYPHAALEHGHGEGVGHDSTQKVALDALHLQKIDLADEVLVLNVRGYIGSSTRREIAHAEATGKPIRYLESLGAAPQEPG